MSFCDHYMMGWVSCVCICGFCLWVCFAFGVRAQEFVWFLVFRVC
jgi:hypothetical protein